MKTIYTDARGPEQGFFEVTTTPHKIIVRRFGGSICSLLYTVEFDPAQWEEARFDLPIGRESSEPLLT